MSLLVMLSLGATLVVFVAGPASASPSSTTKTTTTPPPPLTTTPASPAAPFFVINGTVDAASDHEIVASSAFPNFTKGAVDNYYAMAHSHVDNSPFAQGTASPADTGPVGQTAAAGQFQQPQYADARWPGDSGKATYGDQGGPYAVAEASEFRATADATEATNGLSGPGPDGSKTLALPKGFDLRLRQALAGWKAKWQAPLGLERPKKPKPAVATPAGTVTIPKVTVPKVTVPKAGVTTPSATVTTPIATVTTPTAQPPVSGVTPPPPPVTVPVPPTTLSSASAQDASRWLASRSTSQSESASAPADGESLLTSSTRATLVPDSDTAKADTCKTDTTKTEKTKSHTAKAGTCKTYTLVTSGESSLGRVTLGGGQIVIEGIHVTASIANDGTPTYKAAVSVASASIGGVPVTIDQDGVHVAGQGQGVPYQQASDALNGALKQAGIRLFLVAPEVTKNTCDRTGFGSSSDAGSGTTTSDPSGTTSSCDQAGAMCDQSGAGAGPVPGPGIPGTPSSSSSDRSNTTSSCDQTGAMCDQSGAGPVPGPGIPGTTTTSSDQSDTTSSCDPTCTGSGTATSTTATTTSSDRPGKTTTTTPSDQSGTTTSAGSCGGTGMTNTTGSCRQTGTGTDTKTTPNDQSDTSPTTSSSDQLGLNTGTANSGEETVTATGVHVVFTQPVNQPGVPAQYVEHILGEVIVDSLAVPAGPLPNLGFSSSASSSSSSSSSFSPSCLGHGHSGGTRSGASTAGGSSLVGGSASSGSVSPSASTFGSASQPSSGSGSTGNSLPAAFAAALRKPLWLLLAYLVWQAIVIATGASLWNWRRGGAS
jgi:hypothetical protein